MNTCRRCSNASSATTRSPPRTDPMSGCGRRVQARLLVPGRHTQHRPGEVRPQPDRVQRDGRSDRCQTGHDAHVPAGRLRRRCETAAQHLGRADPDRERRGRRRRGDVHRPRTQQISRVVINAPSVVAAAGSLETPGLLLRSGIGGPAVGAELRLHPASLVSGIYDEPQDPWSAPRWPES